MSSGGLDGVGGSFEVEEGGRFVEGAGAEDRALGGGGLGPLLDQPGAAAEATEVHLVQFPAEAMPGLASAVLDDPDQEQAQPAEQDVGPDALLAAVEDGAQIEGGLHIPPGPLDLEELLVAERHLFGGGGGVGGPEQELAVEALGGGHCGAVDAQADGGP